MLKKVRAKLRNVGIIINKKEALPHIKCVCLLGEGPRKAGFTHVVEITHGRTVFIAGQVALD